MYCIGYKYQSKLKEGYDRPFDVEPKDLDSIVILFFDGFFPSVELFALIDIFATRITSPRKRNYKNGTNQVEDRRTWRTEP